MKTENIKEYIKCSIDTKFAIKQYLSILSPVFGYIPYEISYNQSLLLDSLNMYRFNIIKKSRQSGGTTGLAAYVAIKSCFNLNEENNVTIYVSNRRDISYNFIKLVKKHLLELPRWVWGEDYYGNEKNDKKSIFIKDTQKEIRLSNGSIIKGICNKNELIGYTATHIIVDEAAFYHEEDISIYFHPLSYRNDSKITLISTPNGYDNFFFKIYDKSKKLENDYNITNLYWFYDNSRTTNLSWSKTESGYTDIYYEVDFDNEKMKEKYENGWEPSSSWYNQMVNDLGGHVNNYKYIKQELDGMFVPNK